MEGSARKYGDATKIRAYTAAGLPVITTSVPPLGKDIQKAGAGIVVDDTPEAFAQVIIKVLTTRNFINLCVWHPFISRKKIRGITSLIKRLRASLILKVLLVINVGYYTFMYSMLTQDQAEKLAVEYRTVTDNILKEHYQMYILDTLFTSSFERELVLKEGRLCVLHMVRFDFPRI